MLDIITDFGTFSNFENLLMFMEEEFIQVINIKVDYVFENIYNSTLTIIDVKDIVELNKEAF